MLRNVALVVAFGSVCVACALGPNRAETAAARGAKELDCPYEKVSAYPDRALSADTYVVSGCGKVTRYACDYRQNGRFNEAHPVCVPEAAPTIVTAQARR